MKGEARILATLDHTLIFPCSVCGLAILIATPHKTIYLHHRQSTLTEHYHNVKNW